MNVCAHEATSGVMNLLVAFYIVLYAILNSLFYIMGAFFTILSNRSNNLVS